MGERGFRRTSFLASKFLAPMFLASIAAALICVAAPSRPALPGLLPGGAPASGAVPSGRASSVEKPSAVPPSGAEPSGAAPSSAASCGKDALGTSRVLPVGTQGGLEVGLKTYPRTLALADHEVVLTFDDGPLPATTARLLDVLKAQCVRATFFMIGKMASAAPALAKRVAEEGHTVAYHSFSHPLLGMIAASRARADIDQGFKAVDEAVFGSADDKPRTPFFRYPGFADAPALDAWLASRDIGVFGADLWAGDWWPMMPQAEEAATLARLEKEKRGIILFHDTRAQTVAMMQDFLRQLKARGYRVVHIVPGKGHAETREAGPGWSSETERVIAGIFGRRRTMRN
jgi:peptidoglycan/xylan/chitin deacetylase (PgdA/CDA1 family)